MHKNITKQVNFNWGINVNSLVFIILVFVIQHFKITKHISYFLILGMDKVWTTNWVLPKIAHGHGVFNKTTKHTQILKNQIFTIITSILKQTCNIDFTWTMTF
ncbi:hypothetical protein PK35_08500 [Tamlana nanhaiensis]|uniref:Uncharacterized protein n=1 Tax=Neotamlana nanhaiensis TaxID=1382798 RepID=A0A0D7W1K0_9FLAO|nr:hypothetical protein PK35_08500 [Tamlana nanhaiensis]